MADLTKVEKLKFEKLFDMASGYVLNFNNRTFGEFFLETVGIDIFDQKFNYWSGSKANRLRAFWDQESNYVVGKVLLEMLQYWKDLYNQPGSADTANYEECVKTAERLALQNPLNTIDTLNPDGVDENSVLLIQTVHDSLSKNQPGAALDRLHTFMVKFARSLCEKHSLPIDPSKPLHSIFGEYVGFLVEKGVLASVMSKRILKSAISLLESFNDVRNNQSYAHDNEVLNPRESVFVIDSVVSTIKFIESLEAEHFKRPNRSVQSNQIDDLPF